MRVAEPALRRPRTRPVRLFGCLYKRKILIFYSTMRGLSRPHNCAVGNAVDSLPSAHRIRVSFPPLPAGRERAP